MTRDNPLLDWAELPRYSAIEPRHVRPAVEQMLAGQRAALAALEDVADPDLAWLERMEQIQVDVESVWGPVAHLNAVVSSPELRNAYNECLPLITEFQSELGQNEKIYRQFVALEASLPEKSGAVGELVRQSIRDFRLAGVALTGASKDEFRKIMLKLASLQARFEQNLMDATDHFSYHEAERSALAGLPASVLDRAEAAARESGETGWQLGLDAPTFQAVLKHAESRPLREHYYRAWVTRASDQGPRPEEWDNAPIIEEILALRHQAARLLGFDNFAAMSLATKMAESVPQVLEFLDDLAERCRDFARRELDSLTVLAGEPLEAWDVPFYSEKLKHERLRISDEALRDYFPLPKVLEGLFGFAKALYGLEIEEAEADSLWHSSARYYRIRNQDGDEIGGLLTDLYARPNKRGGAWMDTCRSRSRLGALRHDPIAYLVCNFSPQSGNEPSYLTHYDVLTLFHEFGHSLHHLLTEIDYPSIAGINGVAWDAVELPSQFLENYAWLPDVLTQISSHRKTGEPLPGAMIDTLGQSRRFLSGLAMVRQLEFALFDFHLHSEPAPARRERVQEILEQVRDEVAVVPTPAFNRFQCSFAHIFGGGYAAGYYSYKWAEVLAADAFAAFEETGAFDRRTADRFRDSILAVGGSRDAMDAFVDFRGRPPDLEPLLRQAGLTREAGAAT